MLMSDDLIISDPEIMGGTPCIRGTRITVYAIAARMKTERADELLADYPYITRNAIEAAVAYAARVPFTEALDARPWRITKMQVEAE